MSAGKSMTTVAAKAKRVDLAVVISRTRTEVVRGDSYEVFRATLGRVSRVTNDGVVKRYESATAAGSDLRERKVQPQEQVLIVNDRTVDVDAALTQYRKHTWRATDGADSDMIRPYESMDDVRTAIKPFKYTA